MYTQTHTHAHTYTHTHAVKRHISTAYSTLGGTDTHSRCQSEHLHITARTCSVGTSVQAQTHENVHSAVCNFVTTLVLSQLPQPNSTPSHHRIILPKAIVVECEVHSQKSLWQWGVISDSQNIQPQTKGLALIPQLVRCA